MPVIVEDGYVFSPEEVRERQLAEKRAAMKNAKALISFCDTLNTYTRKVNLPGGTPEGIPTDLPDNLFERIVHALRYGGGDDADVEVTVFTFHSEYFAYRLDKSSLRQGSPDSFEDILHNLHQLSQKVQDALRTRVPKELDHWSVWKSFGVIGFMTGAVFFGTLIFVNVYVWSAHFYSQGAFSSDTLQAIIGSLTGVLSIFALYLYVRPSWRLLESNRALKKILEEAGVVA